MRVFVGILAAVLLLQIAGAEEKNSILGNLASRSR
jgi:hypothetical protein